MDGSQLTGDVYELEVTDLEEEVQRGGLTIQKLDSQTGTTPQGDASLEGISFEIVNQSTNPVVVNGTTAAFGQGGYDYHHQFGGCGHHRRGMPYPTVSTPCGRFLPTIPC